MSDFNPDVLSPLPVHPVVYELRALPVRWRWCRLSEVCATASGIVTRLGGRFEPSAADLIDAFALVTRLTYVPEEGALAIGGKRRVFRYAHSDGRGIGGKPVPELPPLTSSGVPFALDHLASVEDLFVPEGWALDALKLVRCGVVRILHWGSLPDGKRLLRCVTFEGDALTVNERLEVVSAAESYWVRTGRWTRRS